MNIERVAETSQHESSKTSIVKTLEDLSSKPLVRHLFYTSTIVFFFAFILLPPVFGVLLKIDSLGEIYAFPELLARAHSAIIWSFITAFVVSLMDLIAGLPLAWFIVRSKSRLINVIDTLADVPFLIPTAALGYSALLFWSSPGGIPSLFSGKIAVSPGFILVLLLHFTFSFPVIVRVMVGELLGYKEIYEFAAKTLGAQPFTAVRTITLPLLKPALVASFLLSFSRSLSETGATVMVAGAFENGPVYINNMKKEGFEGPLVYVSFILILTSVLVFFSISLLAPRLKLPLRKVWPELERKLSTPASIRTRDSITLFVFLFFAMAPSIFVCLPLIFAFFDGKLGSTLTLALTGSGPWTEFWNSMLLSYSIGSISTLMNVILGLPVAIAIARKKLGRTTPLLDAIVNIPIVIPSIALGASLSFFWGSLGSIHEFWPLVVSHTTITYTYFVRSMSAAIESIPLEMEEVACTLGAKPFTVFRKITLPLTKYSVFSGAILVFTRSVSETGAAIAVSKTLKTAPVLLMDWVKGGTVPPLTQALGVGFLILASFLTLLLLRIALRAGR